MAIKILCVFARLLILDALLTFSKYSSVANLVQSQRVERMVGDYLNKTNNYNYNNYNLPPFSPLSEIVPGLPHYCIWKK
jgi:hypothetical protein